MPHLLATPQFLRCPPLWKHYEAPEPLRIWNEEANGGRGDVFVNFCPTKMKDWTLEPGHTYVLRYRVLTFDGTVAPETAERLWEAFAAGNKE